MTNVSEELTELLTEGLQTVLQYELQSPIRVIAVSANGAICAFTFNERDAQTSDEYLAGEIFLPPITFTCLDKSGKVLRLAVDRHDSNGAVKKAMH